MGVLTKSYKRSKINVIITRDIEDQWKYMVLLSQTI